MKAYRIGRVQEPWTNIEPPIRSSLLQKKDDVLEEKHKGESEAESEAEGVAKGEARSRLQYTESLEQEEIAKGIRDNPSLDPETQAAITKEYRAMHEQIKDMGLYQCPYQEYGKEMIRYSILFGAFIALLRAEWYLTSAVFLGMFWVCPPCRLCSCAILTDLVATNHVYRTRCWTPWNYGQLRG